MHTVKHPTASQNGEFQEFDPVAGTPATVIPAQWTNMVQEELRAAVIAGGLAPDEFDNGQLARAILRMSNAGLYTNRLDNPWFQVNQRDAGGTVIADNETAFGPDRWKIKATGGSVTAIASPISSDEIGDAGSYWGSVPILGSGRGPVGENPSRLVLSPAGAAVGITVSQIIARDDAGRAGPLTASASMRLESAADAATVMVRIQVLDVAGAELEYFESEPFALNDLWQVVHVTGQLPQTAGASFLRVSFEIDQAGPGDAFLSGAALSATDAPILFPSVRPFLHELAACQRYFESSSPLGVSNGGPFRWVDYADPAAPVNPNQVPCWIPFRSVKREPPTITIYSPDANRTSSTLEWSGTSLNVTGADALQTGIRRIDLAGVAAAAGPLDLQWEANAEIDL